MYAYYENESPAMSFFLLLMKFRTKDTLHKDRT